MPPDYRDQVDLLMSDYMTPTEGADAYAEIGLDIADFDLVYAYPWPGEEDWLIKLVRRHGGPRTRLMIYTVRDGYEIVWRSLSCARLSLEEAEGMEAAPGIEPGIMDLQSIALPLGYAA